MVVPRFSVFSVMAVAGVVAFDCTAFRSIAARPEFLSGDIWWGVLATLPMANVLAFAMLMRGRRRFLAGFQVFGWAILVATLIGLRPSLEAIEAALESCGIVPWLRDSQIRMAIMLNVVIPAVFLAAQCVLATIGGVVAIRMLPGYEKVADIERFVHRSRLVAPALGAVLALTPVIAVEAYFRTSVDPLLARFSVGALAVVDFRQIPDLPVLPPAGSPLAGLGGARVRVDSDAEERAMELCLSRDGTRHFRDRRTVRVTLLDGDKAGDAVLIPHCTLRTGP